MCPCVEVTAAAGVKGIMTDTRLHASLNLKWGFMMAASLPLLRFSSLGGLLRNQIPVWKAAQLLRFTRGRQRTFRTCLRVDGPFEQSPAVGKTTNDDPAVYWTKVTIGAPQSSETQSSHGKLKASIVEPKRSNAVEVWRKVLGSSSLPLPQLPKSGTKLRFDSEPK